MASCFGCKSAALRTRLGGTFDYYQHLAAGGGYGARPHRKAALAGVDWAARPCDADRQLPSAPDGAALVFAAIRAHADVVSIIRPFAAMRCTAPWSCTISDIRRRTTACGGGGRGRRLRRPLAQKFGRDEREGDRRGQAAHTRRDDLSRVGER